MKERLDINIDEDLKRRFKKYCVDYNISMSEKLEEIIKDYLKRHKQIR